MKTKIDRCVEVQEMVGLNRKYILLNTSIRISPGLTWAVKKSVDLSENHESIILPKSMIDWFTDRQK